MMFSRSGGAIPLSQAGLPDWADPCLDQPQTGDLFATRLWYDTLLAHALPRGAAAMAVSDDDGAGRLLLPMMRSGGALRSLTGAYSLAWRPLYQAGLSPETMEQAARRAGSRLCFRPPTTTELLDRDDPAFVPFLRGLRAAGLRVLPFDHVGNWHETLPEGMGWKDYIATREPTLRTTVQRKLSRTLRTHDFELAAAPGPALEAAILAYEDVRARSWKPEEPFPRFDGALLRAAAAVGIARIGVLRDRDGGAPVAAQYWMLDRPGGLAAPRRATVLKLSYVEQARAGSPGTVLTAMMIRELLEKDGVRLLDFGRGDDAYKQHWVRERRQRIGLVIADPRHPAGLAAIGRHALGAALRRLRARG